MVRVARYNYLSELIKEYKCKSILEIGTCRCESAVSMIQAAKKNGEVIYYGFDLFEMLTDEICNIEKSKSPMSYKQAKDKLSDTGIKFNLFIGKSSCTVPNSITRHSIENVDLIFVDGGHSYETIKKDWENIQSIIGINTIVVIDDYMPNKAFGIGPAKVVDEIDMEKFIVTFPDEAVDCCSRMVKVTKK